MGVEELGGQLYNHMKPCVWKLLKIVKYYRILRTFHSTEKKKTLQVFINPPAWPLLINTNSLHQYSNFHVYKMLSNHSRYNIHKISTQLNHYHLHSIDEELRIRNEFLKAKQLLSVRAEIWSLQLQGPCSDHTEVRVTEPKLEFCLHMLISQIVLSDHSCLSHQLTVFSEGKLSLCNTTEINNQSKARTEKRGGLHAVHRVTKNWT